MTFCSRHCIVCVSARSHKFGRQTQYNDDEGSEGYSKENYSFAGEDYENDSEDDEEEEEESDNATSEDDDEGSEKEGEKEA